MIEKALKQIKEMLYDLYSNKKVDLTDIIQGIKLENVIGISFDKFKRFKMTIVRIIIIIGNSFKIYIICIYDTFYHINISVQIISINREVKFITIYIIYK